MEQSETYIPDNFLKDASILLFFLFFSSVFSVAAQNSDTRYHSPITETAARIEQIFHIQLKDDHKLLEGKYLDYANWRIVSNNLEASLTAILSPFDLMYWKEDDHTYSVREFDYPRRTADVGYQRLKYLGSLYTTKNQWETRKETLKACMEKALWLDSIPELEAPELIKSNKRTYKGYSVENFGLEVLPGVYVTGSIYKPFPLTGKKALVLSPNGHFGGGRYRESEQLRCATLAKMGAITVSYDLFAWGESALQFPSALHKSSIAQSIQVLNGKKLLDYFLKLPEVDHRRVGITGGSGGGSHSLFLTAIDDRIKVSIPVVMVSSYFSGGCPCESGQAVHLCGQGTNNAEIAAMAAPRPQLIISDGQDWTQNVPELEYPFIKNIYGFYNAENSVKNIHFPEEGHDYKESKRKAMYPFMAQHLDLHLNDILDKRGNIIEEIVVEHEDEMKVFGKNGELLPTKALKDINKLYALFGVTYQNHQHE